MEETTGKVCAVERVPGRIAMFQRWRNTKKPAEGQERYARIRIWVDVSWEQKKKSFSKRRGDYWD